MLVIVHTNIFCPIDADGTKIGPVHSLPKFVPTPSENATPRPLVKLWAPAICASQCGKIENPILVNIPLPDITSTTTAPPNPPPSVLLVSLRPLPVRPSLPLK